MTVPSLEQIETDIAQLSLDEQVWLMERLAQRIRQAWMRTAVVHADDLAAMAADPAVQAELQRIAMEFAATDADGLECAE